MFHGRTREVAALSDPSPLQFPTHYPIRVVGRAAAELRPRIDAVVRAHVPELEDGQISERPSANGNFVSITYAIVARDREQVTALVGALVASDGVLMVI
jgi:putative lipoic acid-binding regulatory protein